MLQHDWRARRIDAIPSLGAEVNPLKATAGVPVNSLCFDNEEDVKETVAVKTKEGL